MPGYLENNVWQGAGDASSRMGDAFTRAIVGTQQLRYQQAQMQQQQAMEAARLEMERQRLIQNAPLINAQTAYNRAGAAVDEQKVAGAKQSALLGQLVNQATQARQMVMAPGQGGQFPMSPELSAAIPAGQYTQEDLANRLYGLMSGAGAQVSLQNPASAVGSMAQAAYSQTPQGLKDVAVGFPPKQGMSPEQEFFSKIYAKVIADAMAPETTETTNLRGEKTKSTTRDIQGGLDLSDIIARGMFPGSTNLPPRISAGGSEAPPPQAPGLASRPAMPKPGDVRRGYRFKGGDPSKQESWEVVQ